MIRINTIKGCEEVEDYYYITTCGRVISKKGVLANQINKKGYEYITLWCKNKRNKINKLIHRLVALAFIPNADNKPQVNHIDEVKTHNYVSNLEWMTAKENSNYGTRTERSAINRAGELNPSYGKKNEWLINYNKQRTGSKNPNSKPMEYYEVNAVTRGSFKRTCKAQGWDFTEFEEIFATQIINKIGCKKDKKYYYKFKGVDF